jgi:hypothetical protein
LSAPVNAPFSLLAQVLDPASAGGVMTQVTAVYQEVKGRVIVGLGDSYASGEGNPDYPANYSKPKTLGGTHRPLPASGPHWLDPACHRSVYSHQQRIAMQLAAENRQSVVSFLGYACSGATIPDVMDASDTHVAHVEPVTRVSLRDAGVRKQADIVRRSRRGRSSTMRCATCAPMKGRQPRPVRLKVAPTGGQGRTWC